METFPPSHRFSLRDLPANDLATTGTKQRGRSATSLLGNGERESGSMARREAFSGVRVHPPALMPSSEPSPTSREPGISTTGLP